AALERAVDLAPEDAELRRSLARALHAKGDHERALALLTARGSGTPDAADLRTAASIHADRGERGAARAALARAVELEPESPELRDALAEALEANGEAAAAEAERATARGFRGGHLVELARDAADAADTSLADAPEASHSAADLFDEILTTFPKRNPQTGRPIATVALTDLRLETYETADRVWEWLAPRRLDRLRFEAALTTALSRHFELAPVEKIELIAAELEHLQDASPDPSAVAIVNAHLETDAVFTVLCFARSLRWTGFAEPAGSYAVELRMLAGASQPAVVVLENGLRLPDDAGAVQWNPRALAIYAFVVLLLASPLLRGWGTLLVRIEYESLGKSVFSIRVSKKPEKAKQGKSRRNASNRIARFQRRLRFVGRYQRHMVGKQTRFAWLPARTYHVAVHGLLQDAVNDEVVGNYFEEKIARVRRGRAVELGFDFRPTECPVEVTVMRGDQRDCQATVALRGDLHSQRYARDGTAILYLGKGRHGILIGSTDRVAEREVEIDTLEPRSVLLNLADENLLVFRDCPAAVEPYLQNDLEAAARALERGGQAEHANLLRAEHYQTLGQTEKAAVHFEAAGRDAEAADLRAALADHARAAALYERAGDYARAAEMYRLGGDPARAGAAYESWGEFDAAIECFREAGDRARESDLLEKTGRYYEAAQLCMELGDVDAAIRALQQIDGHQPEYGEGCRLLAQLLSERGEFDLAIQKFEEAITIAGDSRAPIETQEQFADLLTRAERYEAALEVYERIRAREFHHAGATARIAELKTRIAEATQPVAPAVTESRYEILGELGRGGMGVVFKARDRRLGRTVALKQLPENLRDHPTAVALFLREARAAAALNHMNIVTLFDAGEENGVYFLTMELLEGHPLQKILAHRRQLTPRDVGRLGLQVAAALNYAHGRRIVHRDIKTANLFFTRERVLKVMDFGLAKMLEEVRRASTVIGGTPYYMAPEQGAGEAVDHRADLYALGVTLFELATGGVPYRDGDVIHHHRHSPIPDPRERVDGIPDVLAELILALMAKDPDDRPESAAVVSAHLQRVVDASA
ncbi:MAG: protein kinase, partial [Deltaproteobacteria bacterium]